MEALFHTTPKRNIQRKADHFVAGRTLDLPSVIKEPLQINRPAWLSKHWQKLVKRRSNSRTRIAVTQSAPVVCPSFSRNSWKPPKNSVSSSLLDEDPLSVDFGESVHAVGVAADDRRSAAHGRKSLKQKMRDLAEQQLQGNARLRKRSPRSRSKKRLKNKPAEKRTRETGHQKCACSGSSRHILNKKAVHVVLRNTKLYIDGVKKCDEILQSLRHFLAPDHKRSPNIFDFWTTDSLNRRKSSRRRRRSTTTDSEFGFTENCSYQTVSTEEERQGHSSTKHSRKGKSSALTDSFHNSRRKHTDLHHQYTGRLKHQRHKHSTEHAALPSPALAHPCTFAEKLTSSKFHSLPCQVSTKASCGSVSRFIHAPSTSSQATVSCTEPQTALDVISGTGPKSKQSCASKESSQIPCRVCVCPKMENVPVRIPVAASLSQVKVSSVICLDDGINPKGSVSQTKLAPAKPKRCNDKASVESFAAEDTEHWFLSNSRYSIRETQPCELIEESQEPDDLCLESNAPVTTELKQDDMITKCEEPGVNEPPASTMSPPKNEYCFPATVLEEPENGGAIELTSDGIFDQPLHDSQGGFYFRFRLNRRLRNRLSSYITKKKMDVNETTSSDSHDDQPKTRKSRAEEKPGKIDPLNQPITVSNVAESNNVANVAGEDKVEKTINKPCKSEVGLEHMIAVASSERAAEAAYRNPPSSRSNSEIFSEIVVENLKLVTSISHMVETFQTQVSQSSSEWQMLVGLLKSFEAEKTALKSACVKVSSPNLSKTETETAPQSEVLHDEKVPQRCPEPDIIAKAKHNAVATPQVEVEELPSNFHRSLEAEKILSKSNEIFKSNIEPQIQLQPSVFPLEFEEHVFTASEEHSRVRKTFTPFNFVEETWSLKKKEVMTKKPGRSRRKTAKESKSDLLSQRCEVEKRKDKDNDPQPELKPASETSSLSTLELEKQKRPSHRKIAPIQKPSMHRTESSDNSAIYGTGRPNVSRPFSIRISQSRNQFKNDDKSGADQSVVALPEAVHISSAITERSPEPEKQASHKQTVVPVEQGLAKEHKSKKGSARRQAKATVSQSHASEIALNKTAPVREISTEPAMSTETKFAANLVGQNGGEMEAGSSMALKNSTLTFYISSSSSSLTADEIAELSNMPPVLVPTCLTTSIDQACQTSASLTPPTPTEPMPPAVATPVVPIREVPMLSKGTDPDPPLDDTNETEQSKFSPVIDPDNFRINISDSTIIDSETGITFRPAQQRTLSDTGASTENEHVVGLPRLRVHSDVARMSDAELRSKLQDLQSTDQIINPIIELLEYVFYILGLRGVHPEEDFFVPTCHVEDSSILWNAWKSKSFTSNVVRGTDFDPRKPMSMFAYHTIDRLFHFLVSYCAVKTWSFSIVDRASLEASGDMKVLYELFHSGVVEIPADRPKVFTGDILQNRQTLRLNLMNTFRSDQDGQLESTQRQKCLYYLHLFKNDAIFNPSNEEIREYRDFLRASPLDQTADFTKKDDIFIDVVVHQWLAIHDVHHRNQTLDADYQSLRAETKRWLAQTTLLNFRKRYGPLGALKMMANKYIRGVVGTMSHEHRTFVSSILKIEENTETSEWTIPDNFLEIVEADGLERAVHDYIVPYRFENSAKEPREKQPPSKKQAEREETFQILEDIYVKTTMSQEMLAQKPSAPRVDLKALSKAQFYKQQLRDPDIRRHLLSRSSVHPDVQLTESQESGTSGNGEKKRQASLDLFQKLNISVNEELQAFLSSRGGQQLKRGYGNLSIILEHDQSSPLSDKNKVQPKKEPSSISVPSDDSISVKITSSHSGFPAHQTNLPNSLPFMRNSIIMSQEHKSLSETARKRISTTQSSNRRGSTAQFGSVQGGLQPQRSLQQTQRFFADATPKPATEPPKLKFSPNITRFVSARLQEHPAREAPREVSVANNTTNFLRSHGDFSLSSRPLEGNEQDRTMLSVIQNTDHWRSKKRDPQYVDTRLDTTINRGPRRPVESLPQADHSQRMLGSPRSIPFPAAVAHKSRQRLT